MNKNAKPCNNSSVCLQFPKIKFADQTFKPYKIKISSSSTLQLVILLSSLCLFCLLPSITCNKHSLDSNENIGQGIDQWPSSDALNSTYENDTDTSSQELDGVTSTDISANSSRILTVEEEENEEWDGNQVRRGHTRVAAVAVYASVILIALFGVLIKYFVTQYETLQAKAQLEYQQLRNVRC